jgi:hypothetical protein
MESLTINDSYNEILTELQALRNLLEKRNSREEATQKTMDDLMKENEELKKANDEFQRSNKEMRNQMLFLVGRVPK